MIVASLAALPRQGAAQPRNEADYLFLLKDKARVKGTIDGNVGVNEPLGKLQVGRSATIRDGTVSVADRVFLRADATVFDVFANTLKFDPAKATISGTITQPVPAPVYLTETLVLPDPFDPLNFPPVFPIACGGSDVLGDVGQDLGTLSAGSYDRVRVNRHGSLELDGGTYQFCRLKVDRDATVRVTAPTTINVRDQFVLKNGSSLTPSGIVVSALEIQINVEGKRAVRIGQKASLNARLFVPNAFLRLGRGSFVAGHFLASSLRSDRGFNAMVPDPVCGDGVVDPANNETCERPGDPQPPNGSLCRGNCTYCGDGIVDSLAGEECDDGNAVDGDGCTNACTLPACGDGILNQPAETCEPPGTPQPPNGNDCRSGCTYCGDGNVDPGEECDDGNAVDGDGCTNACTLPACGDGILNQPAETCEPPGTPQPPNGNDCRSGCTYCGDGNVDPGEECDDGDSDDNDECRNDCSEPPGPTCGDGEVNAPGETCEPLGSPQPPNGSLCRDTCTFCGDANQDPGEECDDGNSDNLDDCRNDCTLQPPCTLSIDKTCLVPTPPPTAGNDCQGKVVSMTLEYTGESCAATTNDQSGKAACSGNPAGAEPVSVVITRNASAATVTPSAETIDVGETVTIAATGTQLKSSTEFDVRQGATTLQSLKIHTSCSKPLNVGDQFGSMLLVELTTTTGGTVPPALPGPSTSCEITAPVAPHCNGKVKVLHLRYIGGDCAITPNDQSGKATCTGDAGIAEPVQIVVTRDTGDVTASPATETIALGDVFTISRSPELKADTEFDIRQGGGTLQSLKIHTSCSKPLNLGDRFGAVEVVALDTTGGGLVQVGADVEYTYTVTNAGPTDVTDVAVVDSVLGPVPGSPVPVVQVGVPVVLTAIAFVGADTTNVVTATGTAPSPPCEAQASATVSIVTPPVTCDNDHKVAAITLRYTGEGCAASNNPQQGKAVCTGDASFAEALRILIRDEGDGSIVYADESGIDLNETLEATAANAGRSEFKAQTLARIFNLGGSVIEEDEFHTSCSKPLAVGDKFGSLEIVDLVLVPK